MLAVAVLLGLVATVVLTSLSGASDDAKRNACFSYKGDIEVQVQRWWRIQGSAPAANLGTIGADTDYFPSGLPVCPVDGSVYTIDTSTGEVVGHTH